jgi:Uncharacterized protein conserved in bacteria
MNTMRLYDITIDVCPKCGSVWLDGGELPKLTNKFVFDPTPDELENLNLSSQPGEGKSVPADFWNETTHRCSRDGQPLSKHFFAGDSGIGIETCHVCNGFWLDGNELGEMWHYLKPNPMLESAMQSFLEEQERGREWRQKLEEIPLRAIQFGYALMLAPPLALVLLARPIIDVLLADGRAAEFNKI